MRHRACSSGRVVVRRERKPEAVLAVLAVGARAAAAIDPNGPYSCARTFSPGNCAERLPGAVIFLLLCGFEGSGDDFTCFLAVAPAGDFHPLTFFKVFVAGEKMFDCLDGNFRQILDLLNR